MAYRRTRKKPMSEINVVPYIDVMLVLLIIFMITTPLLTQGIKIDLPVTETGDPQDPEQKPLVVDIDADGNYYVNIGGNPKTPVDRESLYLRARAVLKSKPGISVLVRGDRGVDYGSVVAVMSLLKQAGAPGVGLVTEPLDKNNR